MLTIMYLNTWGGTKPLWRKLRGYLTSQKEKMDIFCFQEVHHNRNHTPQWLIPENPGHRTGAINVQQLKALRLILGDHVGYFTPSGDNFLTDIEPTGHPILYGNAMFIRNTLPVVGFRSSMIYRRFNAINDGLPAARTIQIATIVKGQTAYVIANLHGIWTGNGKDDCKERNAQTMRITEQINRAARLAALDTGLIIKVILGGDFNITSKTESMAKIMSAQAFGNQGAINLNVEYDCLDTRTVLYPSDKQTREADFILVSRNLNIGSFAALAEPVVSDHRPLVLSFE